MDRSKLNRLLARYTSLPRYQIRRSLAEFSKTIGQSGVILDLGCGAEMPYRRLFRSEHYFGIDLFEPADIRGRSLISWLPAKPAMLRFAQKSWNMSQIRVVRCWKSSGC